MEKRAKISEDAPLDYLNDTIIWSEDTNTYGLNKKQEHELFIDQSGKNKFGDYIILKQKVNHAREWLASFFPDELVPQELSEEFEEFKKHTENETKKDRLQGISDEMKGYGVAHPHPIAFAMRREHGIDSKPILSAAIGHARKALEHDDLCDKKIQYVVGLFKDYELTLVRPMRSIGAKAASVVLPEPVLSFNG